jgi:hypothetical protein
MDLCHHESCSGNKSVPAYKCDCESLFIIEINNRKDNSGAACNLVMCSGEIVISGKDIRCERVEGHDGTHTHLLYGKTGCMVAAGHLPDE